MSLLDQSAGWRGLHRLIACPISTNQHALQVREPYGVWGGLTEEEDDDLYAAPRSTQLAQVR